MFGDDLLQKQPKFRDVPNAVIKIINRAALGGLPLRLKCKIERSAGDDNSQITVEDKEGFTDCIDDGGGQQTSVFSGFNGGEELIAHRDSTFLPMFALYLELAQPSAKERDGVELSAADLLGAGPDNAVRLLPRIKAG